MLVGWPLLALLEWKFHRCKLRYVVGGIICALLSWLFMQGAFFPGAWNNVWTSKHFWVPRLIFIYSLTGFGAGVFYTAIVAVINWKFPPHVDGE